MKVIKLKKRREYLQFNNNCKRFVLPSMIVLLQETDEEGTVRIGYTASKKVGNAVKRNLAKRRMKALFDQQIHQNPNFKIPEGKGLSMNWVARAYALNRDFSKMRKELQTALNPSG